MKSAVSIFWFRRDLRLQDNAGLFQALQSGYPVVPVFIFDRSILDALEDKDDRRVEFIHQSLSAMQDELTALGSSLDVRYGTPRQVYEELLKDYEVKAVYTNHDYEPYAIQRDQSIGQWLQQQGCVFHTFKDQVLLEKNEVLKDDGKPYTVFTPYSRKWKAVLAANPIISYNTKKYFNQFFQQSAKQIPSLASMGFTAAGIPFPAKTWKKELITRYKEQRDIPSLPGTSRLSVHLRFGTISIRELAKEAGSLNETFLNELIWRDFYHMILWHFPQVGKGKAFKPEYDTIEWRKDKGEFALWCEGRTGYPIVDAGMRELNATGYMHNRVRMLVASFLTKNLLIDWRQGEKWFWDTLVDADVASNPGNWQWVAGCGVDAAPYFRIFNPLLQGERFDPRGTFVRRWLPELAGMPDAWIHRPFEAPEDVLGRASVVLGQSYPRPIVDLKASQRRARENFAALPMNRPHSHN